MATYDELVAGGTTTRAAATRTGISRASAARRKARPTPVVREPVVPVNRLTCTERAKVLAVLNSAEFVDCAPIQVYATLLDRGVYLCSISTMYRILAANAQVKERRRLARHPARVRPELVATGPGQVYTWDIERHEALLNRAVVKGHRPRLVVASREKLRAA